MIFRLVLFFMLIQSVSYGQIIDSKLRFNGKYVGGLNGTVPDYYSPYKDIKATYVISNGDDFINSVNKLKSGDIIYIPGEKLINLSGYKNLKIPSNVKIIGDRGQNGSKGALLYTTSSDVQPLFEVVGNNVTFYGIRIRGEDGEKLRKEDSFKNKSKRYIDDNYLKLYNENMYSSPVSTAIATFANNLIVENCEIYQWTNNGVYFKKGSVGGIVRYCYIHHNQRFGLGYGVTTNQAEILVEGNLFNFNRHSIASTGRVNSIYVVRGNIFKEGGNESWAVDMHGGKDKKEGNNIAGTKLEVSNNIFYLKGKAKAVVVRGVPVNPSTVHKNKIIYLDNRRTYGKNSFSQYNGKGNFRFFDNEIIERK